MIRHLAAVALLSFSIPAFAVGISDLYVIPAAAHLTGATGESWQTDVSFFNPGTTPLVLDLALVSSGGASTALRSGITVAPRSTLFLADVVGTGGGSGAIVVSGNHSFAIMSRAVASSPRGTFAQTVLPAAEFIDATTRDSYLTGLTASSAMRSNIGFFAAADRSAPMTITISLFAENGVALGSPLSFSVPAGLSTQRQVSTRSFTSASFDNATAQVSITSGSGVATAYGSVIANDTGSAAFIAGSTGAISPSAAAAALRAHFGWQ